MAQRVISEHSNQLHQLLVSVSRHLYFGSDGYVKYQEKPMEVNISNFSKSRKDHLVYYIVRDHFSGTFTLLIASTQRLHSLADFLYYAWSNDVGEDKYIWGMPDTIMIPRIVYLDGLAAGLNHLNIKVIHPSSGFASGVRVIKDIEDTLLFYMRETVDHSLEGLNKLRAKIYNYLIKSSYRENYYCKWLDHLPSGAHPRIIPPYADFIELFAANQLASSSGLSVVDPENVEQEPLHNMQIREGKPLPTNLPKFSPEKLSKAQDLIYQAWEEPNRQKRLDLARRALHISPYCADAYNLLADSITYNEERLQLYEQGVKVGRMSLGDLYFKRYTGDFWVETDSRPYMRSLEGWSECLWKNGQRQEAIQNYQEMLRLNPRDNQGIRYTLINCLLEEGLEEEAAWLLTEYEEPTCFMLYSKVLLSFRRWGKNEASKLLSQALSSNVHVPPYLLGVKYIPRVLPDVYQWGSQEEAVIYAADAIQAWKTTSGALDWLSAETDNIRGRF